MAKEKKRFFQEVQDVPKILHESPTPSDSERSPIKHSNSFNRGDKPEIKQESFTNTLNDPPSDQDFVHFSEAISSILGEIPCQVIQQLYDTFKLRNDKLSLAVDYYFKQEEKKQKNKYPTPLDASLNTVIPPILMTNNFKRKRTRGVQLPFAYAKNGSMDSKSSPETEQQKIQGSLHKGVGFRRYVGTVYTDAYSTRPYLRPLSSGQKISIKSLKPKKSSANSKERFKQNEFGVVRLYASPNEDEQDQREIGRIKEDLSRVLAPLIDLGLAEFDGSVVVEINKRLSIGDTIYIKIDCFLTKNAFENKNLEFLNDLDLLKKNFLEKSKFNFRTETEGETNLKLRQYAIYRLFERLQIKSVRVIDNKEVSATQYVSHNEVDPDASVVEINSDNNELAAEEEEESSSGTLTLNQLQSFYLDNQLSEILKALPNTTRPPVENFRMKLRVYQRHGLSWMLAREKELETLKGLTNDNDNVFSLQEISDIKEMEEGSINPLWKTFKWPKANNDDPRELGDMCGKYFYGNMYSGELSLSPPLIKSSLRGGILADEMGLGKTISALALVNSSPYDLTHDTNDSHYAHQTSLVIVPMSLLSQWKKEFDKANNNPNHKCIIYYGQLSVVDLSSILVNKKKHIPIVMLTTYGTVMNEYAKIEKRRDSSGHLPKTGLFSVKFFRILIDEGHQIRNRTTKTSRAVFELQLSRKWVLTGTPIINRLDDLYSVVKFLELEPWNNFSYWKTFVTLPFEQKQIKQTLDVVKSILEPILLRRTKDMKGEDGKPLVSLPSKEVVIEEVKFNEKETKLYNWFKDRANKSFRQSMESGEVLRSYSQILTHILRLRQICCHLDLVANAFPDLDEDIEKWEALDDNELKKIKELVDTEGDRFVNETEANATMFSLYKKINVVDAECTICTASPIGIGEMAVTTCGHCFCLNCLIEHIDFQKSNGSSETCPNCRSLISKYKLFKVRNKHTSKNEYRFHVGEEVNEDFPFQLYLYDPDKVSSKAQALINHIVTLKDQKMNQPVVVFSQFSSYLDLIQNELKLQIGDNFIRCLKFDGRLSENQRMQLLEDFNKHSDNPEQMTVLLISLKAGGVGLNLTNASRAFMMDPWWSPSIEDQAIDRLHRIGQNNSVKVVRFIMENSIETKMLKIQEMKKSIGEVVGVEEEEKRRRRIEELQILFEE